MKYKIGDRVRIKNLDWYNENKDEYGIVDINHNFTFYQDRSRYCGKVFTIDVVFDNCYTVKEDNHEYYWVDEMIEELVEEPKFKKGDCVKCSDGSCGIIVTCDWSDSLNCYQYYIDYIGTLDAGYQCEKDLQTHSITTINGRDIFESAKWKHEFECPDGYIFKDENGNIINATKIVMEKKGKEYYPKTYEECAEIIAELTGSDCNPKGCMGYMSVQLTVLQKLLICRDAYWKIAGDEMELGKPWEPDYNNEKQLKYGLYEILKYSLINPSQFAFPTEEMRDAFKENFDPDIKKCKMFL